MALAISFDKIDQWEPFGLVSKVLPEGRTVKPTFSLTPTPDSAIYTLHYFKINDSSIIQQKTSQVLSKEIRNIYWTPFWRRCDMRRPKKSVVKAANDVLHMCPDDNILLGFSAINYGNGTIALLKNGINNSTLINIGAKTLSYAIVDIASSKVIKSGNVALDKKSVIDFYKSI